MNTPRILVTRRWPDAVEQRLAEICDVQLNADDRPMTAEELRQAFCAFDAVLPTVSDRITAEVMGATPLKARLVGNFGVGFNHIDIQAAKSLGLTVTNTPEVLTDCTADLTMTLLLAVARRAGEGERQLRAGKWSGWRPTHMMGAKVTGKVLGLIGFGRIGRAVAHRAHHGFGMRILVYDAFPCDPDAAAAVAAEPCASIDEVLARSDFVSLHCPGSAENRHLIDSARLSVMPSHAILINTARGDVVEEAALAAALKAGAIGGAGLDVHEFEPQVSQELASLENAVLLPHLGSATRETRVAMGMRVIENIQAFFAGGTPPDRVA